MNATIEKIIQSVHQELDWDLYNHTNVQDSTNCFAHAIGSTVTSATKYYRLGILSGKKPDGQAYISTTEVRDLFLADTQVLGLEVEEITFSDRSNPTSEVELQADQYIVALFVKMAGNGGILDFHFLRYDKDKGWSEKRFRKPLIFLENIALGWPSAWNDKLVGTFRITR